MGDTCEIHLEKETYKPGEVVNGSIQCNFISETTIKAVRVKISGIGKVSWKLSRYSYQRAQEVYLDVELNLISDQTTTAPGQHSYPFTCTLPSPLPSSMVDGNPTYFKDVVSFVVPLVTIDVHYGCIEYTVQATIERSWALKLEASAGFGVYSHQNIKEIEGIEKPVEVSKAIIPPSILQKAGPITVVVNLKKSGYVLSEDVSFTLTVKNASTVNIQYIQFKFVQGYVFQAEAHTKSMDSFVGDDFVIKDGSVECGMEMTRNLVLKLPPDMFVGTFTASNIIKNFWELRGEIHLPFPNKVFTVRVPLTIGST